LISFVGQLGSLLASDVSGDRAQQRLKLADFYVQRVTHVVTQNECDFFVELSALLVQSVGMRST
jgi:hypothetical protein